MKLTVPVAVVAACAALIHDVPDAFLVQAAMPTGLNSLLLVAAYSLDRAIISGAIVYTTLVVDGVGTRRVRGRLRSTLARPRANEGRAVDLRATQKPLEGALPRGPLRVAHHAQRERQPDRRADHVLGRHRPRHSTRPRRTAASAARARARARATCCSERLRPARSSPARWSRRRWASRSARIEVQVEGDLDLRGTLGVDKSVGAGFEAIRLRFDVDAPEATAGAARVAAREDGALLHGAADAARRRREIEMRR